MRPPLTLVHEFVESFPDRLKERTLYVSVTFATATHKCCCGCGREVVTPFSPTDWKLIFDGETVSLSPSIGNWSFPCRSHYWIRRNEVEWADGWTQEEINAGRTADARAKDEYFRTASPKTSRVNKGEKAVPALPPPAPKKGVIGRIKGFFRRN